MFNRTKYKPDKNYINTILSELPNSYLYNSYPNPKVSIIIPIFNKEHYLHTSLRSVQSQTFIEIEIICIDDGSTDKSAEIVENHQKTEKRIILIKNNTNRGTVFSRYIGVMHCKSEYILFLDPDDYYCSNMTIETLYNTIKNINTEILHFKHIYGNLDNLKEKNIFSPHSFNILFTDKTILSKALINYDINYDSIANDSSNNNPVNINNTFDMKSMILWDKLIKKDLLLKSYSIIGEQFLNTHLRRYTDWLISICLFMNTNSYYAIEFYGIYHNKYIDSVTYYNYELDDKGVFLEPERANKDLHDAYITLERAYEICPNNKEGRYISFNLFKKLIEKVGNKTIRLCTSYNLFKDLAEKYINNEYINQEQKFI